MNRYIIVEESELSYSYFLVFAESEQEAEAILFSKYPDIEYLGHECEIKQLDEKEPVVYINTLMKT